MARILITGAGGYIGTELVQQALASGHEVVAADRFFFGEEVLEDLQASGPLEIIKVDIRDLAPKTLEGVDCVFDLAALSNDPSGDLNPGLTRAINYEGRTSVARSAKSAGVGRYVLSSSCSIYGFGGGANLDESSPAKPLTEYARSTLDAEKAVLALNDSNFCVSALRNATVFGLSRRMRFDLVVNLMTLTAVQKGRILIMGGGKQWRPLIHVKDVARAFLEVFKASAPTVSGHTFNVGLTNIQILNLAYVVREHLPFHLEIEVAPDDDDKRSYNVTFEKAGKILGFHPQWSIGEGVKEIYDALKRGTVDTGPKTSTVGWYKKLLEADQLVAQVKLNGRLL